MRASGARVIIRALASEPLFGARPLPASRQDGRFCLIGNDIIDLEYVDSPHYQHIRHVDRVCTTEEGLAVRQSPSPSVGLAVIWAAKEATYKLLSKRFPRCNFIPRGLVSDFRGDVSLRSRSELQVAWGDQKTKVSVFVRRRWVHAIASTLENCEIRWEVRPLAECGVRGTGAQAESEAVRRLAGELLRQQFEENAILGFEGSVPQIRWKGGACGDTDGISMSHHGDYAAVAVGRQM